MPEEKAKRLAIGATVAGCLVVLFLVVVLIVQFVQIGIARSESKRLQRQIEQYEELLDSKQRDLDWFESQMGMYREALKQGWKTP